MVGGTDFENAALQPRHPGPPPAGLLDQAVHPRDRARSRGSRPTPATRPNEKIFKVPHSKQGSTSTSTTTTTSTPAARCLDDRDDLLRQLDLRRSSASKRLKGKTIEDRTQLDRDGRIHKTGYERRPDLDQPGDGARRARRRRHARSAGPTPTRRSATTATGSAAPSAPAPATARSPTPRSTERRRPHDQGRRQRPDPPPGGLSAGVAARRRASSKPWSAAAPVPTPRSAPQASGARRARPRTTATPGSAAAISEVTACVWVGYADTTTPMSTALQRRPGEGGTFPALIWAMTSWIRTSPIEENSGSKETKPSARKAARRDRCRRRRRPDTHRGSHHHDRQSPNRHPKSGSRTERRHPSRARGRTSAAPEHRRWRRREAARLHRRPPAVRG